MNKIFSCFFFISFSLLMIGQVNDEAAMKSLREREMKSYRSILDYNVNPNTLNYHLRYQKLELAINPAVQNITGKVTSHFVPNQNMSNIYFDFTNTLTVSEVKYHSTNLSFTQLSSKEIKIDFPTALPPNLVDSLSISYSGVPQSTNDGLYYDTVNGQKVAFSLNEPYGAREWFPTKQSMNDKIERVDLKITTPNTFNVAGNGLLISETALANNQKLTYWRTYYPIPAYLIGIGVAPYVKMSDTIGTPAFPFLNYLYPASSTNQSVLSNIQWTKNFMNLFEQYYGAYPYRNEKYGHMEFTFGGGMEHATMTSLGSWSLTTIAHELAHQWFGDKITCGAWNDIWLNEGFATYGQHLSYEKLLMDTPSFMNYLKSEKDYITSQPGGSVYVSDANLSNTNMIFSSRLTYSKGGFVVRMMKWVLGDDVFYPALKDYLQRPNLEYNYARTIDLKNSFLQSTGVDFTEFFNQWIYGQGYPTYTIKWNQTGNNIIIKANQTQSDPSVSFFKMPLPIKVNGTNGEVAYLKLNNTSNGQSFVNPITFQVSSVEFNYEYQIIEKNSTVSKDTGILATHELVNNQISIYPNPVKEVLYINSNRQNEAVEIYTPDGKIVMHAQGNSIIVSALPKGSYLLKIGEKTIKFIKE